MHGWSAEFVFLIISECKLCWWNGVPTQLWLWSFDKLTVRCAKMLGSGDCRFGDMGNWTDCYDRAKLVVQYPWSGEPSTSNQASWPSSWKTATLHCSHWASYCVWQFGGKLSHGIHSPFCRCRFSSRPSGFKRLLTEDGFVSKWCKLSDLVFVQQLFAGSLHWVLQDTVQVVYRSLTLGIEVFFHAYVLSMVWGLGFQMTLVLRSFVTCCLCGPNSIPVSTAAWAATMMLGW